MRLFTFLGHSKVFHYQSPFPNWRQLCKGRSSDTTARFSYQPCTDTINPSAGPRRCIASAWTYLQAPSPLFSSNQFMAENTLAAVQVWLNYFSFLSNEFSHSQSILECHTQAMAYRKTVPASQFTYCPKYEITMSSSQSTGGCKMSQMVNYFQVDFSSLIWTWILLPTNPKRGIIWGNRGNS